MKLGISRSLQLGLSLFTLFAFKAAPAAAAVEEHVIKVQADLREDTLLMYPSGKTQEPLGVVLMNHGFMMSQAFYRETLAAIAEQGFVVLAPQMGALDGLPFGKPTTAVEAKESAAVLNWARTHLAEHVDQAVDFNKLALVNHSRGSKTAWTMIRDGLVEPKAVAAIDPVDSPLDGIGSATAGVTLTIPALIIGSGLGAQQILGTSCAPTNSNYNLFWKTAQHSPSWLFVAKDYGHMDFLDATANCGMACRFCVKAAKTKSPADLRSWIGTTVGAFLRGAVFGDAAAWENMGQNPLQLSLSAANH